MVEVATETRSPPEPVLALSWTVRVRVDDALGVSGGRIACPLAESVAGVSAGVRPLIRESGAGLPDVPDAW
jgi:hypothetical protein